MRGAKGRRASREGRVDAGLASLHELSASNAAWLNRISSMRRHDSYRFHRASGARSRPPPPTQEHVTLNTETRCCRRIRKALQHAGGPPVPLIVRYRGLTTRLPIATRTSPFTGGGVELARTKFLVVKYGISSVICTALTNGGVAERREQTLQFASRV
jgi:hypothetical protein